MILGNTCESYAVKQGQLSLGTWQHLAEIWHDYQNSNMYFLKMKILPTFWQDFGLPPHSTKQGQFRKGSDVIRLPGLVNFSVHQKLFVVVGSVGIVWSPGQYNTPDPFRPFGTGLV